MTIEIITISAMNIEAFAEAHGLTLQVVERRLVNRDFGAKRYYAQFMNTEISRGIFLESRPGEGDTVDEAIKSYAFNISERDLVFDAGGSCRKEIKVPRLISREEA